MATLNEPTSQGEGSGGYTVRSGEDRMEHDIELMDPVSQTPHDLPLSGCHTPGSDEGSMTLKELMNLCTTLLQKVLDLENVKTAQAKETASLKKRVTKLEQRQSSRISGFHPFKADEDIDTKMIVEDKGNGEKGGSITETASTARPYVSAIRPEVDNAKPKLLLQQQLYKGKGILQEPKPVKKKIKMDQDQIKRDDEVSLKIQAHLDEKARTEKERQKVAYKASLSEMYDEVQTKIDADHELAVRLTHEEQEKYIAEERSKLLAEFFERRKKHLAKERAEDLKKMKRELEVERKEQQKTFEVVLDDDKAIDYETLDVESLIVDYESQVLGNSKAGDVHIYKLTRLDGSYRNFSTFSRMLEVLDRQDVLDLHKIIIERFLSNDPKGYDLILWGYLKTLVESSKDDEI
nr:hypothetical protein [Tanacetum cinerariifolium]